MLTDSRQDHITDGSPCWCESITVLLRNGAIITLHRSNEQVQANPIRNAALGAVVLTEEQFEALQKPN